METRLYRIKVFKEKTPYFWVAYGAKSKFRYLLSVEFVINKTTINFKCGQS